MTAKPLTPRDRFAVRRVVEWRGRRLPLSMLARETGRPLQLLVKRIVVLGWDVERAVSQPARLDADAGVDASRLTSRAARARLTGGTDESSGLDTRGCPGCDV